MLEERFKQLQNQVDRDFSCNESLNRSLDAFQRKEAAEMEAAEKEGTEKEATEEDDEEEEDQCWQSLSETD
jgi:hypothetical protein